MNLNKNISRYSHFNYKENRIVLLNSFKCVSKEFHTSVILLSDQSQNAISDAELIQLKLEAEELSRTQLEFNAEVQNIRDEEIKVELDRIEVYLDNKSKENELTGYDSVDITSDSRFIEFVQDENKLNLNVNDAFSPTMTNIMSKFMTAISNCEKNGFSKDCLESVKLNKVIESARLGESVESSVNRQIIESIKLKYDEMKNKLSNVTLGEIYELFEKRVKIYPNYMELGFGLVSYALLLKSFNKFVDGRPIPKGLPAQDKIVIQHVRQFSRIWFAGLVAPLMIIGFHEIRKKRSMFNVEIKTSDPASEGGDRLNNNIFGALLLLHKKINTQTKIILILLLIIIFLLLKQFNLIPLIISIFLSNIKIIISISMIIPIMINIIILLLLRTLDKNGNDSVLINSLSRLFPNFLNIVQSSKSFINYLIKIVNNKELLNYYKSRGYLEILFYVALLLMVFIFF